MTDLREILWAAAALTQPVGAWSTSAATCMERRFCTTAVCNRRSGDWNTAVVTDMSCALHEAAAFNQPIGTWITSAVTAMREYDSSMTLETSCLARNSCEILLRLFARRFYFFCNPDWYSICLISSWLRLQIRIYQTWSWHSASQWYPSGGVLSCYLASRLQRRHFSRDEHEQMLCKAGALNQPTGVWNTSAVNNMALRLARMPLFNQPIGAWNTSTSTTLRRMFGEAAAFNQPIGAWNTRP